MIEKKDSFTSGDNWVVYCDGCPEFEEFEEVFNFARLLEILKENGWFVYYKDGGWKHACCIDCKERK